MLKICMISYLIFSVSVLWTELDDWKQLCDEGHNGKRNFGDIFIISQYNTAAEGLNDCGQSICLAGT